MTRFLLTLQMGSCLLFLVYPFRWISFSAALFTVFCFTICLKELDSLKGRLRAIAYASSIPQSNLTLLKPLEYLVDEIRFVIAALELKKGPCRQGENPNDNEIFRECDSKGIKLEALCDSILNCLAGKTRADLIAITVTPSRSHEAMVFSQKVLSKAVIQNLDHLHKTLKERELLEQFQSLENPKHAGSSGLSRAGFSLVITKKISLMEGAEAKDLFLWLGYTGSVTPSNLERQLIDEMVSSWEKKVSERIQLFSLSQRTSEAEQISKQKSEFLAHMSHDIRSPLNNIRAAVQLLQARINHNSDHEEVLEIVLRNCDALTEIVEDVLDFSKHTAGKLQARPSDFNIQSLVQEVVTAFEPSATVKQLALQAVLPEHDISVRGDRRHIRRAISNLVSNAIKYTDKGEISISLNQPSADDQLLTMTVSDTGSGMTEPELEALFEPFTRFNSTRSSGVGLGLTLTKILLELSNAAVSVKSIPGSGTTFTITLPLSQSRSSSDFSTIPAKILLIDDDPDFLLTTARVLKEHKHRVSTAMSIDEALKALKANKHDLVLTDANVPNGGAERLLKQFRSTTNSCQIVVATGDCDPIKADQLIRAGASRVLVKPISHKSIESLLPSST